MKGRYKRMENSADVDRMVAKKILENLGDKEVEMTEFERIRAQKELDKIAEKCKNIFN